MKKTFTFHEFVAKAEENLLGRKFDSISMVAVSNESGATAHLSIHSQELSPMMMLNDFLLAAGSLCNTDCIKNMSNEQRNNFIEFMQAILLKIKDV